MDDRRFDALTRRLGQNGSRRSLLKSLIGLGGLAATGAVLRDVEAARRGFSGPSLFKSSPTATMAPTMTPSSIPTNTPVPATNTPAPVPTETPVSCGPSGVCCSSNAECNAIPTYCESTAQYPLLWRYYLCGSPGTCTLTAHVCNNASHNCEIDVCADQTGCAVADVQPGEIGSEGAVCCTDDSHCAGLPGHCVGDDWHYYSCNGYQCREQLTNCGAGLCSDPLGCQVLESG